MAIKLLDDRLINKIAAGEVIERPASIVKELMENAMDAGSTKINIDISGGGIDKIEITDNGSGIPDNEVVLAFKRHATSKITEEADLLDIGTMGFRGEALPSIASVSKVELYTQHGEQPGVKVLVNGGRDPEIENHPTAPGTRIIVRDIFFNTPARKKFLKTAVSEGIHIHDAVSRLALSRPDISITFANEKKLFFKTPGTGNLRDTVISIYGSDYAGNYLDLEWSGEEYAVHGLVSKPEFPRANRKNQIFFVNNRLVKSPMLARAVEEAYRGLLLSREYAAALLFITVPKAEVDVNVHPQKSEVRFRDEKVIFRLINHSIRNRLEQSNCSYGETAATGLISPAWPKVNDSPEPYRTWGRANSGYINSPNISFASTEQSRELPQYRGLDNIEFLKEDGGFAVIGQCFDAYIMVEKGEELWLVDQHAAHERIIYSQLVQKSAGTESDSQLLVLPVAFDVSSARMDLLETHPEVFGELGIIIEVIGPNSALIRSAPPMLQGREIEIVNECLELLEDNRRVDIKMQMLAMVACKKAVKAGQKLSRPEMAIIINDLLQANDYKHCPHGRPTMVEISHAELDKRFKRK